MIGNFSVKVTGDTAQSKIICFNPMVTDNGVGGTHVMYCGLWYHDKFVRTPQGWRMCERVEEKCYTDNVPAGMSAGI